MLLVVLEIDGDLCFRLSSLENVHHLSDFSTSAKLPALLLVYWFLKFPLMLKLQCYVFLLKMIQTMLCLAIEFSQQLANRSLLDFG